MSRFARFFLSVAVGIAAAVAVVAFDSTVADIVATGVVLLSFGVAIQAILEIAGDAGDDPPDQPVFSR